METPQTTPTATATAAANPPVGGAPAGTRPAPRGREGFDPRQRRFGGQRGGFGGRPGARRPGSGRRDDRDSKDGFDSKLLDLSRVSHTRAGGRRLRFRAIVISGNKAGKVGVGIAAGSDVAQAVEKATIQSKKSMVTVPIVNGTITHEVLAKVGPAQIVIKPQKKGRGLMAGGVVRLICQLAGIKDISSKMLGTTKNKLNNARATIKAFQYLRVQTQKKGAEAKPQAENAKEAAPKTEAVAK